MRILAVAVSTLAFVLPASADISLSPVSGGFDSPLYVTHAGDGSGRLFVVEKPGKIRIVDADGNVLATPFLDITDLVGSDASERGLLGLAFHPDYPENDQALVNYTDTGGDSVIARYRLSGDDPNRLDPSSAEVLLTLEQPFANHNGGHLAFGPDGFLYAGFGDGGLAADPNLNGQNPATLLATLLRLDVSAPGPYRIPPTNPFVGNPLFRDEIWATGLRNPWRFSFDRLTGDLYIGDVGQDAWEEIDFQPSTSKGGENYGWNLFEGSHQFPTGVVLPQPLPTLTNPVAEYGHDEGCSVTGGYVYRGAAMPELVGTYVFGDFCSGTIWGLVNDGGTWTRSVLAETDRGIASFGEDEAGELYLADLFNGVVFRLE